MRVALRITIGIAAAVAIAVVALSAAWSLWVRELWAPPVTGTVEECPEEREVVSWEARSSRTEEDLGTTQDRASTPTTALTIDQAQSAAETYVQNLGHTDLGIVEVIEFEQSFYVMVRERDTGMGAMELLVDKATGSVAPETGPNMMWNARYGVHRRGAMAMGPLGQMNILSEEQAIEIAQRWLDANRPGVTVEDHAAPFYGYYTIHTVKDDGIEGILSVHGATGQLWHHTWHGAFIQTIEKEKGHR
jgi:hypothetical protein